MVRLVNARGPLELFYMEVQATANAWVNSIIQLIMLVITTSYFYLFYNK